MNLPHIQTLSRLIRITWESALPPCTCAIATLIVCGLSVCAAPFFPSEKRERYSMTSNLILI